MVAAPATTSRLLADSQGNRLVVLGAGFGGITAALTVKKLRPQTDVVVLEPAPYFVSAPGSLGYLFGLVPYRSIVRSYDALRRRGLRLIQASAEAVDPARKLVVTSAGTVGYDYLLVATGLRLAYEEVPGLAERPAINLSFFDSSSALVDARRRIAAFGGGDVVVSTPVGIYKCPPAPYEYALQWAGFLRRRRLRGRVTLIDPRPKPTPAALAPGLLKAMEAHGDRLRYEFFTRLISVDGEARTVETDAGTLSFDLLSVVPPNAQLTFLTKTGLGNPFIDVDPRTFRCNKDPAVFAVGDTADTPYAKTAAIALTSARIAGHHIAHALGAPLGDPGRVSTVCFPWVSPDRALKTTTEWSHETTPSGELHLKLKSASDNDATAGYLRARRQWEATTLGAMFSR